MPVLSIILQILTFTAQYRLEQPNLWLTISATVHVTYSWPPGMGTVDLTMVPAAVERGTGITAFLSLF
jgi:hypothetical protein